MRIISGEFRHRVLVTPKDDSVTRPIPDRVKESLFSLLRGHFEGATFFDGFAGTGAIGLEAISRGAARCVFVERDKEIVKILRQNIENLECGDRCDVIHGDVLGAGALASAPRPLNLAFLDPPYPMVEEPIGLKRVKAQLEQLVQLLTPDGYVLLRTPWPFRHLIIDAPPPPTGAEGMVADILAAREPSRKDKRSMVKKGRSWRRHAEAMDPKRAQEHLTGSRGKMGGVGGVGEVGEGQSAISPELSEEIDAQLEAAENELAAAGRTRHVEADLKVPNTLGPETHVYGTMAVHLYAKPQTN